MTSPQASSSEEEEDVTGTSHKVGAEKQARKHRPEKKNIGKGYVYKPKKKTCKICKSEVFDLNRHMKVHQKEKIKTCKICGAKKINLHRHMRVHERVPEKSVENVGAKRKRRKCEECESEVFNMWHHMHTVHDKKLETRTKRAPVEVGRQSRKRCPECNIEVNVTWLPCHMRKQHKEKVKDQLKPCTKCGKAYFNLQTHMNQAHGLGTKKIVRRAKETCDRCKRKISVAINMERHMIGHEKDEACQTQSGQHVCDNCMKRYDDADKLAMHRILYCSTFLTETVCFKCKRTLQDLEKHLIGHEENEACQTPFGPHVCGNCMKRYDNVHKLQTHRSFYCSQVVEEESEVKETDSWIKQGKKTANYRCKKHGIQFDTVGEFNSHNYFHHRKVHVRKTDIQPATCLKCGITFHSLYTLKYHNSSVHMDKGEGVYKCHRCSKNFNDKILFRDHMKTHPRTIRTKCRFCHLMFVNSETLKKHELHKHQYRLCQFCGKKMPLYIYYYHREICKGKDEAGVENLKKRMGQTESTDKRNKGVETDQHLASDADGKVEGIEQETSPTDNVQIKVSGIDRNQLVASDADCQEEGIEQESGPLDIEPTNISQRYKCSKCSVMFEFKPNYEAHKQKCQRSTASDNMETNSAQDMQEKRESRRIYTCEKCLDIFGSSVNLSAHEAIHRWVECEFCEDILPDEYTLQMHELLECPGKFEIVFNICQEEEKAELGGDNQSEGVSHKQGKAEPNNKNQSESVSHGQGKAEPNNKNQSECVGHGQGKAEPNNKNQSESVGHGQGKAEPNNKNQSESASHGQGKAESGGGDNHLGSVSQGQTLGSSASAEPEIVDKGKISVSSAPIVAEIVNNGQISSSAASTGPETVDKGQASSGDVRKCRKKTNIKKFVCCICNNRFQEEDHLRMHELTHMNHNKKEKGQVCTEQSTEKGNNVCSWCDVSFVSEKALQEHQTLIALNKANYPIRCPYCCTQSSYSKGTTGQLILSECDFLQHKKIFKFSCQFCCGHFEDMLALKRHLRKMHDFEDKKQCPGCSQWFGAQRFQQHMEYMRKAVERLECKCLACGMVFDNVEKLDEHDAANSKVSCRICLRHFFNARAFQSHIKSYHNLSTIKDCKLDYLLCKHCDQSFKRMSELSAHVKQVILATEPTGSLLCSWEGRFKTCFSCGMAFQKQSDYDIHKSVWNFTCYYCHQHFRQPRMLYAHMKEHGHQDKVGVSCKLCNHKFDSVVEKRAHESRIHFCYRNDKKQGRFPCKSCGEVMPSVCQLDIHYQTKKCIKELETIDETCILCRARLMNSYEKSVHIKEHEAAGELRCDFCKKQFESLSSQDFYKHGMPQTKKSVCTVCNTSLVASCQIKAHERSCIEGKTCAYCLETIKDGSDHERYKKSCYQCTCCGIKARARCVRKLHETAYRFNCRNCNQHFKTFTELLDHLTPTIWMNGIIWKHGKRKTMYVCSYCGEKVKNEDQRCEHESLFKFRCLICKKHFSTALETVNHHQTNHCKKRTNTSVSFHNVLDIYLRKAQCRKKKKIGHKSAVRQKGVKYQIGSIKYSILPSTSTRAKEDMLSESANPTQDKEGIISILPSTSSAKTKQDMLSESADPTQDIEGIISEREQPLHDRANDEICTSKDICKNKQKLDENVIGLLYICTKCNLSFEKLCEVENHQCNVCCHCNKRFYGSDVRVKKKRHEEECSYSKRLSEEGTSTVGEGEDTDSCEGDSELYSTSQKEKNATLATDAIENQKEVEPQAFCTSRKGDDVALDTVATERQHKVVVGETVNVRSRDDATMATDTGEKQLEARDEAVSIKSKEDDNDATVVMDASENQHKAGDAALSVRCKEDDLNKVADVSEKQPEAGDESCDPAMEDSDRDKKEDDESILMTGARSEVVNKEKTKVETRWDDIDWDTIARSSRKRKKVKRLGEEPEMKTRRRNVKNQKVNECYCKRAFKTNDLLNKHQSKNSLDGIRCICIHCNMELKTKCHIKYHLSEYPHTCTRCKQHFKEPELLGMHRKMCIKCSRCDETYFGDENQLSRHKAWHHIDWKDLKLVSDDESDEQTDVEKDGVENEIRQIKMEVCKECNCEVIHLKKHLREVHEIDYKTCPLCHKTVTDLEQHRRRAHGSIICSKCKREFKQKQFNVHLTGHAKDEASQTQFGSYVCRNCNKRYDSSNRLGTHRRLYCSEITFSEKSIANVTNICENGDKDRLQTFTATAKHQRQNEQKKPDENEVKTCPSTSATDINAPVDLKPPFVAGVIGTSTGIETVPNAVRAPKSTEEGVVEISYQGTRLPLRVDVKEIRAAVLSMLNDTTEKDTTKKDAGSPALVLKESNPKLKHLEQQELVINVPKEVFAQPQLSKVKCFMQAVPGVLVEEKESTLHFLSRLPTTSNGMVRLCVPAVGDHSKGPTNVPPTSGEGNRSSSVPVIGCQGEEHPSVQPVGDKGKISTSVAPVSVKGKVSTSNQLVCRQEKGPPSLKFFGDQGKGPPSLQFHCNQGKQPPSLQFFGDQGKGPPSEQPVRDHKKRPPSLPFFEDQGKESPSVQKREDSHRVKPVGNQDAGMTRVSKQSDIKKDGITFITGTSFQGSGFNPTITSTLYKQDKVSTSAGLSVGTAAGKAGVSISLPSAGGKGMSQPVKYLVPTSNGVFLLSVPPVADNGKSSTSVQPIENQERGHTSTPLVGSSVPYVGINAPLDGTSAPPVITSVPLVVDSASLVGIGAPYSCSKCERYYPTNHTLKCHMFGHERDEACQTQYGQHVCDNCMKRFDSAHDKAVHQMAYCCTTSKGSGVSRQSQNNQDIVSEVSGPYTCSKCKRNFLTDFALNMHINGHEMDEACQSQSGQHVCVYCMKKYDSARAKAVHQVAYCFTTSKGSVVSRQSQNYQDNVSKVSGTYICSKCKRNFLTDFTLHKHTNGHKVDEASQSQSGQHVCVYCMTRYDNRLKLFMHKKYYCLNLTKSKLQHDTNISENSEEKSKQTFAASEHLTHPSTSATSKNTLAASSVSMPSVEVGAVDVSSSKMYQGLSSGALVQVERLVSKILNTENTPVGGVGTSAESTAADMGSTSVPNSPVSNSPEMEESGVEISFEGKKLQLHLDADETRAAVLSVLNDIGHWSKDDGPNEGENELAFKENSTAIRTKANLTLVGTFKQKPDVKKWMKQKRLNLRVPKRMFATTKLSEVNCTWPAIPGVVGEIKTTLMCLSWLSTTSDGMVTLSVPSVRDQGKTCTSVTPVDDQEKTSTTVAPVVDQGMVSTGVSPIGDQEKTSASATPVGDHGKTSISVAPVGDQGKTSISVAPVGDQGKTSISVAPVGDQGKTSISVAPVGDQGLHW